MKEIIIGINEHKPGEPDPLWTAWKQTGDVVRCKDCIYRAKNDDRIVMGRKFYFCTKHGFYKIDNWYCADGDRKE